MMIGYKSTLNLRSAITWNLETILLERGIVTLKLQGVKNATQKLN